MSIRAVLLSEFLSRPAQPFDWQGCHCGDFAAEWVQFATGRDVRAAVPHRPTWFGTHRAVLRAGGVHSIITATLGEPIPPAMAHDGDLALIPTARAFALGMFSGRHVVARDEAGAVVFLPRTQAQSAWRVA